MLQRVKKYVVNLAIKTARKIHNKYTLKAIKRNRSARKRKVDFLSYNNVPLFEKLVAKLCFKIIYNLQIKPVFQAKQEQINKDKLKRDTLALIEDKSYENIM